MKEVFSFLPVGKIPGKNSDWPGLVSISVPGPIKGSAPRRKDVRQNQIIATSMLLGLCEF
jgi:hypothetical protein